MPSYWGFNRPLSSSPAFLKMRSDFKRWRKDWLRFIPASSASRGCRIFAGQLCDRAVFDELVFGMVLSTTCGSRFERWRVEYWQVKKVNRKEEWPAAPYDHGHARCIWGPLLAGQQDPILNQGLGYRCQVEVVSMNRSRTKKKASRRGRHSVYWVIRLAG